VQLALNFLNQVHNLPKELLAKRNVVHVDIVNDPVSQQVHVYLFISPGQFLLISPSPPLPSPPPYFRIENDSQSISDDLLDTVKQLFVYYIASICLLVISVNRFTKHVHVSSIMIVY
jgi:hypothetical protein